MDTEKHVENSATVYVTTVDSGPDSRRLKIVADDFAAKLPGNPLERAQRFCAILNDLRAWAADAAINSLSRRMVGGLIVAAGVVPDDLRAVRTPRPLAKSVLWWEE
jgi:hypothetical protein